MPGEEDAFLSEEWLGGGEIQLNESHGVAATLYRGTP